MTEINLSAPWWYTCHGVYVYGKAFHKGNLLEKEALCGLFKTLRDEQAFKRLMQEADGIFGVVCKTIDGKLLTASSICGLPQIFYGTKNGKIVISDDPYSIADGKIKINPEARRQYCTLGYIIDHHTLAEGVFRIEPCNYLVIENGIPRQAEYCNFLLSKSQITDISETEFQEQMLHVLDRVFDRAIEACNGRQIAIPLSSGFDSRLIATMLKRKGYGNVICYTVGTRENPEIPIAQAIAKKLGYPHRTVYAEDKLIDPNNGDDLRYIMYVCALCNMPWLFEYPAVKQLLADGYINSDAVFMPGHSGDSISGGQEALAVLTENMTLKEIGSRVATYSSFKKYDRKNIKLTRGKLAGEQWAYCTSILLNYVYKHRLARNINASCLLYSFFNHETYLPFWDKELLALFGALPLDAKIGGLYYQNCLCQRIFSPMGVDLGLKAEFDPVPYHKQMQKDKIKPFIPPFILQKLLPKPKDYTGLRYICRIMEQEVRATNPTIYSKMLNEINSLWYVNKLK